MFTPIRMASVTSCWETSSSFTASSRRSMRSAARNARLGIVLVGRRDPEGRHDGVTDELLDRTPSANDPLAHRAEVGVEHGPEILGIELFAQRGGAGDVREQDRDQLPLVRRSDTRVGDGGAAGRAEPSSLGKRGATLGTHDRQRRSARRTEPGVRGVLGATCAAGRHGGSLVSTHGRTVRRARRRTGCYVSRMSPHATT